MHKTTSEITGVSATIISKFTRRFKSKFAKNYFNLLTKIGEKYIIVEIDKSNFEIVKYHKKILCLRRLGI